MSLLMSTVFVPIFSIYLSIYIYNTYICCQDVAQPNHEGVHIYEFGNHGAVLVMAEVNQATNMVIYSLDEGLLGGFMKFL